MKYSTLQELRILNQITETNVSQVTQTLNQNFEKGLISEELCENSFKELDNLIEKAGNHKYFKREGTPGKYKYYYTEAEYKQAKSGGSSSNEKKVGDIHEYDGKKYKKIAEGKWLEVSEHGMTKKEHNDQLVDMKQAGPSISRRLDDEWEKHASAREGLSDKEYTDGEVGLGSEKVRGTISTLGKTFDLFKQKDGSMFYSDGEGTKYFSMPEENISDFQQRVSRAIQDDFKHLQK